MVKTLFACKPALIVILLLSLVATAFSPTGTTAGPPSHDPPQEGEMKVESFDGTLIDILVCRPEGATVDDPAPVILHSHGWAGARADSCGFSDWLDAGIGVVSISQRGHGESEGEAHVHDPDIEGQDNIAVIDHVETLEWVEFGEDGSLVLGAIGGSYGGGYQFITALTELRDKGETRFNALAPDMTWHHLVQSLAPNGVVRTAWVTALYAAGAGNVHQGIHEAFVWATLTGNLPDEHAPVHDIVTDFYGNSPAWFVDHGYRLDVPVFLTQGVTDNLFNLNEGIHNFERVFTEQARERSVFIGYNGGHALPNVLPPGGYPSGDPCTEELGGSGDLTRDFYRNVFFGESNPMPETRYSIATPEDECVRLDALPGPTVIDVDDIRLEALVTGVGVPVHVPVAHGPVTVAGIPVLSATVTSLGVEQRAFFALSIGETPATALVVGNNMMPLRVADPVNGAPAQIELPGVAVEVPEGQTLYLTASPLSDMSFAHGSRAPGLLLLEAIELGLPVVE